MEAPRRNFTPAAGRRHSSAVDRRCRNSFRRARLQRGERRADRRGGRGSRGLVNHHFGSKENLLWAVVEDYELRWEHEVVVPAIAGKRGLAALQAIIDAHRRMATRTRRARGCFTTDGRGARSAQGPGGSICRPARRWRELGKRWWDEGVEDGDIDPSIDQDANASVIIGAIRGITFDWLIAPGSFDLDAAYEQQWEMLTTFLRPS